MNLTFFKQNKETFELLQADNRERISILNSVIHECKKILRDNKKNTSDYEEIELMMREFQYELKVLDSTSENGLHRMFNVVEATDFFLRYAQDAKHIRYPSTD